MKWGVLVALLAGLIAAFYLIWAIGFSAVIASIARAGFGGLALLCLYALLVFLALALAWYFLLPPVERRPLQDLYLGRLVRDSIAEISPFSPVGGMVAAARLMILKGMNPAYAAASVAADATTEAMAQGVFLAFGGAEVNRPVQGILEVELAGDHVVPERGIGVLEIRQPHVSPRVEGIDRHFLVGRPGDLHPAVDEAWCERRDPPTRVVADRLRLGQKVEHRPGGELGLAPAARGQQLRPARAEFGVQGGDKVDGLRRKDLVVAITVGTCDLDVFGSRHV